MAVVDEVWRLDTLKDEDCLFFQKMAQSGHYGKLAEGKSRQGTYIFTSKGKFLASINDLSADRVLGTMQRGLKLWNLLSKEERRPSATSIKPKKRWEDFYPRDGLVFTIYNRDLPRDGNPETQALPTWNRDSAWFSKDEMHELMPSNLKANQTFEFSQLFVSRLSRMHFLDSVKGQTEGFHEDEIAGSRILGKVIKRDEDVVTISIKGVTRGESKRKTQGPGVETQLRGTAVYNLAKKQFSKFEFVALGERWGRTRFNDRRRQTGRTPVGYVFEMAAPDALPVIPGVIWEYQGLDWLKQLN